MSLSALGLCKQAVVADAVPVQQWLQMPFASGFHGEHPWGDPGELSPWPSTGPGRESSARPLLCPARQLAPLRGAGGPELGSVQHLTPS